jgi:glycosyltransferase involved in cell wall biosynthesis
MDKAEPLKILLDVRCLEQPKTGIQIVAANLLTELMEGSFGERLQVLTGPRGVPDARLEERQVIRSKIAPYDFRRQREVAAMMNDSDADLVLSPTYFMPFGVRKPYVITVHDLIPRKVWLGAPSLYVWGLLGSRMRNALGVWTVSEYSRREILRHHPDLHDRLEVIPSGYSSDEPSGKSRKEDRSLLLFVSRFRHKNVAFALRVFEEVRRLSGEDWKLHVVGNAPLPTNVPAGVEAHGRVTDGELVRLYERCWGVLLPSLEEGFSLPLLEGMSNGCMVFYHRRTAMEETAGDGGIGLELGDPGSWAKEILALHANAEASARKRRQAQARAAEFSRERFGSAVQRALSGAVERVFADERGEELARCA